MYVTAKETAEMLGVSTGYACKIIRGLNEELKAKGYRTICGKVPTEYFEEKFYGLTVAMQETPCGYTIMVRKHANSRERRGFMSATRDGKKWRGCGIRLFPMES